MLYLLEHNDNACIFLSNWQAIVDILENEYTTDIDDILIPWNMLGIFWDNGRMSLATDNIVQEWKSCKKRFMVTLLTIKTKYQQYHANILLYDRETHTLERFEPYQYINSIKPKRMKKQLVQLYKKLDPDFNSYKEPTNLHFMNHVGIQLVQEQERLSAVLDPIGFCQPWVFLYATLRLTYPNQIPETLPFMIQGLVKQNKGTLTDFIRNYSQCLLDYSQAMFARLIKDDTIRLYQDYRVPILIACIKKLVQWQDTSNYMSQK